MTIPFYQIDAFASGPFTGNPAAVCLLERDADDDWMQQVASEMNLSETAFVRPMTGNGRGDWSLRWFTPAAEVELCGHATLASAVALWTGGHTDANEPIRFHTRSSGVLTCRRSGSGAEAIVRMDFPSNPPSPAEPPDGLAETLGVDPVAVLQSRYDWLVELGSEEAVRAVSPDFRALGRIDTRGVIVTAPAETSRDGYDFVSRYFAPAYRIDEDPVTGSAHCVLAPHWCSRLGRDTLTGYQASARGGLVGVTLNGERVELSGRGVTILTGELHA